MNVSLEVKITPYEFSVFALILGAITTLAILIGLYPLIYRQKSYLMYHYVAMIGSTILWCLGYTLEILATDKATMMLWTYLEYIGVVTLPPLFLLFVLTFTHHEIASRPLSGLLFFPPIIHWLLLITNDSHNLFYEEVNLNTQTPFISLERIYGPIFYSHTVYSYLLICVGFILLVRAYFRVAASQENVLYQKQLQIMILGMIAPFIGNLIRIFKLITPLDFLDLTPISFVIYYVLFAFALFEIGFLDIVPFAHRSIIRDLGDIGIVATNQNNIIVDINPKACEYLVANGCQNLVGRNLYSIIYSQERLKPYYEGIREIENSLAEIHDNILNFEMELLDPLDPQREYYRITLKALREKEIIGFIYIVQNISLEKEIELLLRKNIDFKTSLLSVISHDLKNQLMIIQGFTDVLRKELSQDRNFAEFEESLQGIDAKTNQMQQIITDVRSYLKTMGTFNERKELSVVDLNDIIKEIVRSFEATIKKKNLEIKVTLPIAQEIHTMADIRLSSVFNNLLDNAIKWSPDNDIVEIIVSKQDQFWICSIIDHGPGVPEELKDEIFKPFVSIGPEDKVGSGLGLSISLEILQSYKSRIWIEDVKPHGAKFIFKLPIVKI